MDLPFPADLLLDNTLPEEDAQSFLLSHGFSDPQAAVRRFQRMATQNSSAFDSLRTLLPHLLAALGGCADPDQALINLERFGGEHADGTFRQLVENPRAVEIVIAIFAGSQFLTE